MNFYFNDVVFIHFISFVWAIFSCIIGIFVYFKNRYSTVNKIWSCVSLGIGFWCLGVYFLLTSKDYVGAILAARFLHFFAIPIPIVQLHFTYLLLAVPKNQQRFLRSGYLVTIVLLLSDFTPFFIRGVVTKPYFRYYPVPGLFYHIFTAMYFGISIYWSYLLIKAIPSLTSWKRNQIKYVAIASIIGISGGGTTFPLIYNISLPPFPALLVALYPLIITYAIIKYRLMDIKVALTRAGVFAIVYILVLGIPLGLTAWGKSWLEGLFGQNWYWAPMILAIILATVGPFIFMHLLRRAEEIVFKERRHYQEVISNLSKSMVDIRDIEKLFTTLTSTVVNAVKIRFATIYLREAEYKSYQLKSCYPKEAKSRFQELISLDDHFIDILNQRKKPLLSEEIGHQEKINLDSGLVIPCFGKDGLLAIIILGAKPNNDMYTNDDVLSFENLSYATSLTIENCTYWKEIEDRQRRARIQEMDLFSYSLAHEIDNPMNNIKTVATYLKDFFLKELSLAQEKQKEAQLGLEAILESQGRVSGMVKAIEEFGKPTAGEFGPLRLEEVIVTYLNLYLAIFKNHGIFFTKELPEKIPYIRGVKQELMQILANFSNNSIHALLATKEKKIHLKIEVPNQDFIRIIFKDNGYGITDEKLRSIFAPFVTTKASTEGKGMGLYTIRRIIERHKGKVWAESEGKGKGATFFVELPIAKDVSEEDFKKEDRGKRLF